MKTMIAPVFQGEGRLTYESRPLPQLKDRADVLVRVQACGICGTDLNILATPPAHNATHGIVIGHEGVGTVLEIGDDVRNLTIGDRVVIAPRITCGKCAYCRAGLDNQCLDYNTIGTTVDGAFTPYLSAPERALFKISDAVPRDDAVLFEPLSCVVGALARVPFQPGNNVAIIGSGPMGLLFAQVLRAMGAGRIIMSDLVSYRLQFAHTLGVDVVLNPADSDVAQAVKAITGLGADLVIDAVGNQMKSAADLARRGGHIILFGLRPHDTPAVSQYQITRYDLTLHGAFVGLKPFTQTIKLLESGRIQPSSLITHRVPLSELAAGVELMRSGQAMKVIVETQETEAK